MDDVSLREYFEALLAALDRRLDERWASLERRLTLLNDLRGGVLTREEYESKHEILAGAVERNRDAVQRVRGECVPAAQGAAQEERIGSLEIWRSNVMGRTVALGVIGALLISATTALIVHLVS